GHGRRCGARGADVQTLRRRFRGSRGGARPPSTAETKTRTGRAARTPPRSYLTPPRILPIGPVPHLRAASKTTIIPSRFWQTQFIHRAACLCALKPLG